MTNFTGTIEVDDREVKAALSRLAAAIPDGVMGRVYSRGAYQQGRRYDHYVMAEAKQAGIHRGRWQTERTIAHDNQAEVATIYRRGLGRVVAQQLDDLRNATNEALDVVYKAATTYPPERPGQTYVRTGILRASWEKENKL
jgi:hypothetical protein